MKLAYLINQYPKASHTFIRREIRALEELGQQVIRYAIRHAPEDCQDPTDKEEERLTRHILDSGRARLVAEMAHCAVESPVRWTRTCALATSMARPSQRNLHFHFAYLAEACVLLRWCRREGIEHLHTHFATNSAEVAMLCHLLGGPPFSISIHGPEEFDRPELVHLATKLGRARFVVAISHFGRSQLLRHCSPKTWNKIHIVRCGLDRSYLDEAPDAVPNVPRLVCVGRLCEQKGYPLLIDAASRLLKKGVKFELVLVGEGELRQSLQEQIAELGLEGHVRLMGLLGCDEVKRQLISSRALVLPSFAEGLPVVIMEAFAVGRPVISTYVAGIPELVRPGENGWLVPAGSVEHLARAMEQVLAEPVAKLTELAARGRAAVLEQHDARINADRLLSLFYQYRQTAER